MYKAIYVSRKKEAKHKHMLLCQVLKKEGEGHNLMRQNVMFSAATALAMINISQQK